MTPDVTGKTGRVLSIILGASRFDGLPGAESSAFSAALLESKLDFAKYAASISSQILDKFDSEDLPNALCLQIAQFLRIAQSATDLIVYYVGHGGFMPDTMGNSEYFLALRATSEADKYATGLRVSDLAQSIHRNGAKLRAIVVLDCCYAGEAVRYFSGGDPAADPFSKIPFGLTLFTASSSHQEAIVPLGEKRTMFSGGLLEVLKRGIAGKGPLLSIKEIADEVRILIKQRYSGDGVRPEVHSPRQRYGDVADFPLFPNPAYQAGLELSELDKLAKALVPAFPPELDGPLCFFIAEAGLGSSSTMRVVACAIIESPGRVRDAVEHTRGLLIRSTVLDLSDQVRERLRKVGFDYVADDPDVRAKLIDTIATLTYEAYACAANRGYFGDASDERIFCELFGRLLFDRIRRRKSRHIEIFVGSERAPLLDALQGVILSCVHAIDASDRAQVRFPPVIHTISKRDGCLELVKYVAAVVGQRLETGQRVPRATRDYRKIENKIRLIRKLDTGDFFSRRRSLRD